VAALEVLSSWLAGFAAAGPLSAAVRGRAVEVLLDDLAAAVGAAAEPAVRQIAELAARRGPGSARLWAGGFAEPGWAALANAVACSWIELDEGYRLATCHGGLYALPAVAAEADRLDVSLGEVLAALVAGYEVATRVARAYPAVRPPAVHPHASLAAVGAAAGVAALRRMSAGDTVAALGAAASFAVAGPFDHAVEGLLVRNVWPGLGAFHGILACDLAPLGIGGSASGLSEVFGRILGPSADLERVAATLTGDLGARYAVQDGYRKAYACCQYTHSAVEAVLDLRAGPLRDLRADAVERVEVEAHPLAMTLINHEPTTLLAGKFSLPHAVAVAAVTGRADAAAFATDQLADPAVASVRRRVSARPYEPEPQPPLDRPARVTITLRDGSSHHAESASSLGSPDRPVSPEAALAKLDTLTAARPGFAAMARALLAGQVDDATPWRRVSAELLGGGS
jgi:2-methylcitrate dehydratase PrpD